MAQARTEAKLAGGGGGASGVWGISDATGTYTYYSDIASANAAASSGQTIELFANVRETNAVAWELSPNVTYQLNGHTYTLDNTSANAIQDTAITVGLSATILNGTIIRKGQVSPSQTTGLAIDKTNAGTIFCNGVTFINEVGTAGRVTSGRLQGGTFKSIGTNTTLSLGLYLTGGEVFNVSTHSTDGYSTYLNGGDISNSYVYSSNYRALYGGSSNSTAQNCAMRSDANYAVYAISSKIINCSGLSTGGNAIFSFNKSIFNSSFQSNASSGGFLSNGTEVYNCSFISYASQGANMSSTDTQAYNCSFHSTSSQALSLSGSVYNCIIKTTYNNSNGHGLAGGASNKPQAVMNCIIETVGTGTFGITEFYGGTPAVRYSGNVYVGPGSLVNTTFITQGLSTTPDAYGNIKDA